MGRKRGGVGRDLPQWQAGPLKVGGGDWWVGTRIVVRPGGTCHNDKSGQKDKKLKSFFFLLAGCNGSRGYWQSLTERDTTNGNVGDLASHAAGQVPISL